MAERTLNMEMANLICRFGQDHVLLDLIDEVVLPAFLRKDNYRFFGKTRYFFLGVEPILLEDSEKKVVGIIGRFIKDTTLSREQIFTEEKGLIRDENSIQSSPSAIFLLILNNHRLIYIKETKDGPKMETFKSSLLHFLRKEHNRFINELRTKNQVDRENDENIPKETIKYLTEKYPSPTLELIPLTSGESIEDFVRKYKTLKKLEISLLDRNDENDNDPFFEMMQKRKDDIGSSKSIITHSNSGGLNKDAAINEIAEATAQGNQEVKLVGEDKDGDTLRGNNEHFQLRKPLKNIGDSLPEIGKNLFTTFKTLVADGHVKIPEITRKATAITNSLAKKLFP